MRVWLLIALVFTAPVPANACSVRPLGVGERYPTETEILRTRFEAYDSIIGGVVEGPVDGQELVSFRVQQVFKGKANVGEVIMIDTKPIYAPRGCPPYGPMLPHFLLTANTPYVVGFRAGKPRFNEIDQHDFDIMLSEGWITSAR